MILFPAIDIKDGKAVRLYQGRFDKCEEMGIPLEIAKEFEKTGAEFIHLVDLDGAKEGLEIVLSIFPTLIGLFVAIGALRSSGIIDFIVDFLKPLLSLINFPSEIMPLALLRPISGSASISVFSSICSEYGADSLVCKVGSVIQGSTDTTLYVLSLYFSSIGISKWKHSLKSGLIADVVGIGVGVLLSILFFGF